MVSLMPVWCRLRSLIIVDHIGHSLWPAPHRGLLDWVEATDTDFGNQGFINLPALSDQYI